MKINNKILIGALSISNPTSNVAPYSWIEVRLSDDLSSTLVAVARLSLEDFAKATVGRNEVPCTFEFNDSGLVGKKREHKVETVSFDSVKTFGMSDNQKKALLKPFEVDGWQGDFDDLSNHHNFTKNGVRVRFERWVDVMENQ